MSEDIWGAVEDDKFGKSPFSLRIQRGDALIRTVRLELDMTYIGRMPENHIVLDDPKVSRSHARILSANGKFTLEDQKSENGTFINGKRATTQNLVPGDCITIGAHTLELVEASKADVAAVREGQLEQAEAEDWRMDQTISLSSEDLRKKMLEASAKKGKSSEKAAAKPPQMSFTLDLGSSKIEKKIEFKKPRPRNEQDPSGNEIEIRIRAGKWILEHKIPLK